MNQPDRDQTVEAIVRGRAERAGLDYDAGGSPRGSRRGRDGTPSEEAARRAGADRAGTEAIVRRRAEEAGLDYDAHGAPRGSVRQKTPGGTPTAPPGG